MKILNLAIGFAITGVGWAGFLYIIHSVKVGGAKGYFLTWILLAIFAGVMFYFIRLIEGKPI